MPASPILDMLSTIAVFSSGGVPGEDLIPLRARKPYTLTLLRNEGIRGRRPRTIDGSMDNSIEDSFGKGESSVESADRGRGLEDEEEVDAEEEGAGLGCAILELVC